MIYEFIDTVGSTGSTGNTGATGDTGTNTGNLPMEAMSINGEYIENIIDGYRTLTVSGRELFGASIDAYEVGATPGAYFRGSKLPTRTITVQYQLFADDADDFRDKYNTLNSILNVEQAHIIFADETDKYFIGTRANVSAVPAGLNRVNGTFEIYCTDPFKYAVEEKTFTAAANADGILETTIANTGTVPVPIDYEITTNAQNGFYGIVSAKGVMQYGYTDEVDTVPATASQLLFSAANGAQINTPAGTYLASYDSNVSIPLMTEYPGATLGTSNAAAYKGKTVSLISNRGSSHQGNNLISGNRVYTLSSFTPEGSSTPVSEYVNFKAVAHCWFESAMNAVGIATFGVLDSSGNIIAAVRIIKDYTGTTKGKAYYWIPNKANKTINFDLSSKGAASRDVEGKYGTDMQIVKSGAKFTFTFHDTAWTVNVPDHAETGAKKLFVSLATFIGEPAPSILCFVDAKFTANFIDYDYDVPNRYNAGDVLDIIGSEARAYINGAPCLDDEIIGTEYFKADPGNNVVQYAYSDWCATAPTIKAKIREAWL